MNRIDRFCCSVGDRRRKILEIVIIRIPDQNSKKDLCSFFLLLLFLMSLEW
jgi:hypothetical protein